MSVAFVATISSNECKTIQNIQNKQNFWRQIRKQEHFLEKKVYHYWLDLKGLLTIKTRMWVHDPRIHTHKKNDWLLSVYVKELTATVWQKKKEKNKTLTDLIAIQVQNKQT